MLRENRKKKIAIILVAITLLTVLVEILCNTRSLLSNSEFEVTSYASEIDLTGAKHQVLGITYKKAHYIDSIYVEGFVVNDTTFIVQGKALNAFGKEEDFYSSEFFFSTAQGTHIPVQKNVISYTVTLIAKTDTYYVRHIVEQSHFRFNGYRFSLVFVALVLFTFIVFVKDIKKHICLFFVVASLGFGSIMILATGTQYSTWDELTHFYMVYQLVSVSDGDWTEAAWREYKGNFPTYDTALQKQIIETDINELDSQHKYSIDRNYSTIPFTRLAYVPMSAGMRLGRIMNMGFVQSYELAKFVNLLCFTFAIAIAINITKTRKLFIAVISLLPTVLFQGCMLTYDSFVYSLITLGVVLIANEVENPYSKMNKNNILWAMVLIILGSASKAIYIPLILFLFFIPKDKFDSKGNRLLFNLGVIAVLVVVMSTFVQPTLMNTISGNMNYGGDSRGGETGSVKQIFSMLKHPLATVRLYIENIFAFDNYRNMGSEEFDHFIFPNLMLLNLGRYGVAPDKWSMILIPLLLVLFFYNDEEKPFVYSVTHRIGLGIILFMIVGLIWTALYLSFTTIGNTKILGVQTRYYLPILLPTSYVLFGNRLKFNIRPVILWKLSLSIAVFFELHLIYNMIILRNVL